MRDDYAELIPTHDVTVAERDGEIVGVLVVRERRRRGSSSTTSRCMPAARGPAWARRLLQLAEEKARAAGYDSIYLYTQEIMTENQALYDAHRLRGVRAPARGPAWTGSTCARHSRRRADRSVPARPRQMVAVSGSGSAKSTVER